MKKYLLLFCLLNAFYAAAQITIAGRVLDAASRKPIPGVSVYLSNSTIGVTTGPDGKFSLYTPASAKVELIVSHINYEKQSQFFVSGRHNDVEFLLSPKDNEVGEVEIRARKKNRTDTYGKWGAIFSTLLLGTNTQYAPYCKIKNPEVIVFDYDNETSTLQAFLKAPLIVENLRLGYTIKIDLDYFRYTLKTDVLALKYSHFFEEMGMGNRRANFADEWRYKAYLASQRHFMKSMFDHNLPAQGFKVYRYHSVRNTEKDRITGLVQEELAKKYAFKSSVVPVLENMFSNKDTIRYYRMVLKQPDVASIDTVLLKPEQFTRFNPVAKTLNFSFKDSLLVTYLPAAIDVNAAHPVRKSPAAVKRPLMKPLETIMYFVEPGGINIDGNGYYIAKGLFSVGDMADRRLSQLLPWDYVPAQGL